MMFQNEFVRIELKGWFGKKPIKDYKNIVHAYSQNGWRFVQIFAPSTSHKVGEARYFELIFEKKV